MKQGMDKRFEQVVTGPIGTEVEFWYTNDEGTVGSRKTVRRTGLVDWTIIHGIDGSESYFSFEALRQVFEDERSAWDGDRGGYNADESRYYDADGNWID